MKHDAVESSKNKASSKAGFFRFRPRPDQRLTLITTGSTGLALKAAITTTLALGLVRLASALAKGGATVATTGVATLMWILDAIPQLGWLHPWLLVHDWLAFGDLFRDPVFTDGIVRGLWLAIGYTVVFLVAARTVFVRRDVTS